MTHGPPSTAASSSKTPASSSSSAPPAPREQLPDPSFAPWNANPGSLPYPHAPSHGHNYHTPGMSMPTSYYPNIGANPYASYISQPQSYGRPPAATASPSMTPAKPTGKPKVVQEDPREVTPPLPDPETYRHWDDVVKTFLVRAKFMQTLKGFEHDMLVLNPQWEQEVVPDALKEMLRSLQTMLDRVAGKKRDENTMDTDPDVDIFDGNAKLDEEPSLDERKLEYMPSVNGAKLPPHSSINKSISQFLAQTRARNDASNRAEFLYSLAEKRRRLLDEGAPPGGEALALSSCARVDAKPIDRDKQMKFDIAKNGQGPLTKTVKQGVSGAAVQTSGGGTGGPGSAVLEKKRKLVEFDVDRRDADSKSKTRRKSRAKGKEPAKDWSPTPDSVPLEDDEEYEARISAETRPGLEERLKNIEEHLALRYVPSMPRTLFARLKYLEDHIVKLEQEYPPWAALHFNQPSRGWPAPPRATPIIVPPHQRSSSAATSIAQQSTVNSSTVASTSASAASTPGQASATAAAGPPVKSRKASSSLHRAVLDRLEVQRAMDEMNNMRQG